MITLRRYADADRHDFYALFSDPEVMRYVGHGQPLTAETLHAEFRRIFTIYDTDPTWLIAVVQEDSAFVGHAEIFRRPGRREFELNYFIQRSCWGRSIGGKIVDLLLQEARRRSLHSVVATVDERNAASIAILRRRGFVRDEELCTSLRMNALRLDLTS